MPKQTASQTIGPFFHHILTPRGYPYTGIADNRLAGPETAGRHIRVAGRLVEGTGAPVPAALIEIMMTASAK